MNFKKTTIAIAAASVLTIGFAGNANAGALATSVIQMSNLLFKKADGTQLSVADFELTGVSKLSFESTADASTNLNGVIESATNISVSGGDTIDIPVTHLSNLNPTGNDMCVGDCSGYTNNDFTAYSGEPATQFARADQYQAGSPLFGVLDSGGNSVALGATIEAASYVSLTGESSGSTSSNNGLGATFDFKLANAAAINISFDIAAYLETYISADAAPLSSVQAEYTVNFSIVDKVTGLDVFSWSPNGITIGTATLFGLPPATQAALMNGVDESADVFNLNRSITDSFPGPDQTCRPSTTTCGTKALGSFSATTIVLSANNEYRLSASLTSRADANYVPEPSALALMGLGLLGMAGAARRRKSA